MLDDITIDGNRYRVTIEADRDHGAPWDEEDGHGPVSDWTRRDKRPGELTLDSDGHGSRHLYDFAEACRIARRDGWGFLPGQLRTDRQPDGTWRAWCAPSGFADRMTLGDRAFAADAPDVNAAIRAVYAAHRATMTARQYAAGAALADYDRLRAWCNDDWHYVGVVVTADESCPCCDRRLDESESCWGVESDAGDYLDEVAQDLAEELHARLHKAAA